MPMKDQTRKEPNDPMEGEPPVKTSRLGCAPSRHGGKRRDAQDDPWMIEVLDPKNLMQAWKRVDGDR